MSYIQCFCNFYIHVAIDKKIEEGRIWIYELKSHIDDFRRMVDYPNWNEIIEDIQTC